MTQTERKKKKYEKETGVALRTACVVITEDISFVGLVTYGGCIEYERNDKSLLSTQRFRAELQCSIRRNYEKCNVIYFN